MRLVAEPFAAAIIVALSGVLVIRRFFAIRAAVPLPVALFDDEFSATVND